MDKINVGFIGLGRISDLHAIGYRDNPEARIYGVSSLDENQARARQSEWGAEKLYTDYHDMLADPDIDAVEILTPQKLHETMVLEAVAAGKHIMVQKPMTIDLPSADRMLKAAESSDRIYKVIENYIFYPPLMKAKELLDSGAIGDPINMRIKFISGSDGGWDIDPSSWEWRMRENAEGRGMQTFDHGHHMWCVAWYLLGDIDKVFAWIDSADGIVDCPSNIIWKYKDGVRYGSCDYSHCREMNMPSRYYANDEWFEITGSRGILLVNRCTGNLRTGPVLSLYSDSGWKHFDDIDSDWAAGFRNATLNFISAIKGREAPLLSGQEAREILKIALAIIRSSNEQREVYLDEMEADNADLYAAERRRKDLQENRNRKGLSLEDLKNRGRIL